MSLGSRRPGPVGGSVLREIAEPGHYVPLDTIMEHVYGYKDGPDWQAGRSALTSMSVSVGRRVWD